MEIEEKSHGKQAKSEIKLNDLFSLTTSRERRYFLVEVSQYLRSLSPLEERPRGTDGEREAGDLRFAEGEGINR